MQRAEAAPPLPPRSGEGEGRERAARRRSRLGGSARTLPLAAAGLKDRETNAIPIGQDVMVPETKHAEAGAFDVARASLVVFDLLGVLSPVDFDDQAGLNGQKVQKVTAPG